MSALPSPGFFPGLPVRPGIPSIDQVGGPSISPSIGGVPPILTEPAQGLRFIASSGSSNNLAPAVRVASLVPSVDDYNDDLALNQVVFTVGEGLRNNRDCLMNIPQLNEVLAERFSSKMRAQKRRLSDYDMIPEHKVMLQSADSRNFRYDIPVEGASPTAVSGSSWVDRSNSWLRESRERIERAPNSSFVDPISDRQKLLDELSLIEEEQEDYTCKLKMKAFNLQKGVTDGHAFDTLAGMADFARLAGVIRNMQRTRQGKSMFYGDNATLGIGGWYTQVQNTFNTKQNLDFNTPLFVILRRSFDEASGQCGPFEFLTWGHKHHKDVPLSMLQYKDTSGNIQVGKAWELGKIQYFDDYKEVSRAQQLRALGLSGGLRSKEAAQRMSRLPTLTIRCGVSM